MMASRRIGIVTTLWMSVAVCGVGAKEAPAPSRDGAPLALVHVEIVDPWPEEPRPARDQTVIVREGRIVAVGPAGDVAVPEGATVVDGTGRFLVPGLWDMHVHLIERRCAPLFVANGVTGVRVMWGDPAFAPGGGQTQMHTLMRKAVAEGDLVAPRMVLASNILDGPKPVWPASTVVTDAESARKAVRQAKERGADFVKVYSKLSPEAFRAIAEEAKAVGLPFAGHVPSSVSAREAAERGMVSIEHLTGVLVACSSAEEEVLAGAAKAIAGADAATMRPQMAALARRATETYDPMRAEKLFATFRERGVRHCPTLNVLRAIASLDDPKLTEDPRLKYVPTSLKRSWDPKVDFRFKTMTAEDFGRQKKAFERSLELVGAMHKAGVPILAGTDEVNPYCLAGFSLHDELALLVKAGLSPRAALRAATVEPAKLFGKTAELGPIAPGRLADLVLLDADPTQDIARTTRIRGVVADGRWFDRGALDRLLTEAEETFRDPAAKPAPPAGGFCPHP